MHNVLHASCACVSGHMPWGKRRTAIAGSWFPAEDWQHCIRAASHGRLLVHTIPGDGKTVTCDRGPELKAWFEVGLFVGLRFRLESHSLISLWGWASIRLL